MCAGEGIENVHQTEDFEFCKLTTCAEQASINPKIETVEELEQRRKRLHLGMCKLLQEDLSLYLSQANDEILRSGETQVRATKRWKPQ
jgi:hypothetical protein